MLVGGNQNSTKTINQRLMKAQQTGIIQIMNLELNEFPKDIIKIDELKFDSQNWWQICPITKLDLSNNNIKDIPEEIVALNELISIRMQNNKLEQIPECLFLLENLKSLDFSHNRINLLPPNFIECSTLVELILMDNQLSMLPVSYGKLVNLEVLELQSNRLTKFRLYPGDLPKLKKLDLSQNNLTELDENMGSLTQLETLILSKNKISNIPTNTFRGMKKLRMLDLKENRLTSFTDFPETETFDAIFLSYNMISSVGGMSNSPKMTIFDVKNNKINKINPEIAQLKELKTLDVSNNDIGDIPCEVGFMTKLVRISLEGNPLKCIRSNIRQAGAEQLKKYLRERTDTSQNKTEIVQEYNKISEVDVWDQFIKDFMMNGHDLVIQKKQVNQIHDKFCQLQLTTLDLSKNIITEINPNIMNLTNLVKLRLNDNQITFFPGDILLRLPQLEELELKGNKLESLLDDVDPRYCEENLKYLKHVDLSQNKLTKLPEFLPHLPKLRVLFVAFNKIDNIETLFTEKVYTLEILDVSNNKIKNISQNIAFLDKLEHLNLEYNDIVNVPTVIGFLTSIKKLNLYGNPIKNIRNDIITKGPKFILENLRTKHQGQFQPPQRHSPQKMIPEKNAEKPEDEFEIKNYKVTQINPKHQLAKENQNNNVEFIDYKSQGSNSGKQTPQSFYQGGQQSQASSQFQSPHQGGGGFESPNYGGNANMYSKQQQQYGNTKMYSEQQQQGYGQQQQSNYGGYNQQQGGFNQQQYSQQQQQQQQQYQQKQQYTQQQQQYKQQQQQYEPQQYQQSYQQQQQYSQQQQNQYQKAFNTPSNAMIGEQGGVNPQTQILIKDIDTQIRILEKDLEENFMLSTNMINMKKREINQLRSQKNKIMQGQH